MFLQALVMWPFFLLNGILLLEIYSLWLYACLNICDMLSLAPLDLGMELRLPLVPFSFPHGLNSLVLWNVAEDL